MKNLFAPLQKNILIASLFLSLSTGCITIKLISPYDEITDKTINSLQEEVTRLLLNVQTKIGTNQASYENYTASYEGLKVKLQTLETRLNAMNKSKIVQSQVAELKNIINNIELLHKMGFQNKEQILAFKQPLDAAFEAMIKLQMALKREKNQSEN